MTRRFYVRFGSLPRSGRSAVAPGYRRSLALYGGAPLTERGVSVFDVTWDPGVRKWVIPSLPSYVASLDVLLDEHLAGRRPIYLVVGRRVRASVWEGGTRRVTYNAEGQDGEPLLANVQIVGKLTLADLWNRELMGGGLFDEHVARVRSSGCDLARAVAKTVRRRARAGAAPRAERSGRAPRGRPPR